jgi:Uma2 family endonuclease
MPEIVISDAATIPAWVVDHATFRRWATSEEFPERGWFSFLGNRVWADLNMERTSHNLLKMAISAVLTLWVARKNLGRYYGDRMLLSHLGTGFSTEPDGMFVSWQTLRSETVREIGGDPTDGIELVGTPDMVMEIVSRSSVRKDTIDLLEMYQESGIREYWLINPLDQPLRFDILKNSARGFRPVRASSGWRKSSVFGGEFRLVQSTDPLGQPAFALRAR